MNWPKSTEIGKFLAKERFYSHDAVSGTLKQALVEDVEKITVEIKGIENNELYNADIDLKINDNNLDINKFTCGILKESVFAMISTLKVDEEINEIKIDVEV